ncbi:hypothetical protein B0O80DRAFT_511004 [Mortierella sp. GBAus27b]|nr:hypothetical protein B0O80DRAFT_511004 [Mortierella sp. GBAus27b]
MHLATQLTLATFRQRLRPFRPFVHHRGLHNNVRPGAKEPDDEWTQDTLSFYGITFKDTLVPRPQMKVPRPKVKLSPEFGMIVQAGTTDSGKIYAARGVPRVDVEKSRRSVARWLTSKMLDCAWKQDLLCSPSFHTMANIGVMVIKPTDENAEGVVEVPIYTASERAPRQAHPENDEASMVAIAIASCQRWKWSDDGLPVFMFRYLDPHITIYRTKIEQHLLDRVRSRHPMIPETPLTVVNRFRLQDTKDGFNVRNPFECERLMRFLCEVDSGMEFDY